jgi:hypothetical protein
LELFITIGVSEYSSPLELISLTMHISEGAELGT